MNSPFVYDSYVTNRDFIGRKSECGALSNLITSNENIVIYAPPKSGKSSLIQQVLFNKRLEGMQYLVSNINMFNIRNSRDFLVKFGNAVVRGAMSSPKEYEETAAQHLAGTCFVFDRERLAENDEVLSIRGVPRMEDMQSLFELPLKLSKSLRTRMLVVLEEFQSILAYEDCDVVIKAMEKAFMTAREDLLSSVNYIITGSKVNAMKYIFEHKRHFHRLCEHLSLLPMNEKDVVEHLRRGFMQVGKDLERERAKGACNLFKCNIWYLNHFSSICNSMAIGYINDGVMMDALNALISIHAPRLMALMSSLTDNQISFLKAVLDGVMKFSSAEIIEKYSLHSSANVKRVREALFKKEVITNEENGDIVFLDPLFEYWVRTNYFGIQ